MRVVTGAIAAVFAGLLAGVIMGEYELRGAMAIVAGVIFGLAIAETAITIGKSSDWPLVGIAAASAFGGYTLSAYIDTGSSFGRIAGLRWAGAILALVSAGYWVRSLGSRAVHNPMRPDYESPEPTES